MIERVDELFRLQEDGQLTEWQCPACAGTCECAQYSYSMEQNLEHLPNILSNLFTLYRGRNVGSDGIEMYCLAAYHRLVNVLSHIGYVQIGLYS